MTPRLANLIALRDAVKEGRATADHFRALWPGGEWTDTPEAMNAARAARDRDMNAALAFHEAVLPDALVASMDQDSRRHWYVTLTDVRGPFLAHEGASHLAVALFLADMAALIAIEEGKG